jgi:hypothetical protein
MKTAVGDRIRARALALSLLWLCLAPILARGDGGTDELFKNPDQGIIEGSNESLDVEALTADKKPHFSGSISASGGFVFGLSRWENPFADPSALSAIPFYLIDGTLKLDVRPASFARLFASFEVTSPYADPATPGKTAVAFSPLLVDELFLDYTLAERLFFRIGKQEITWGQGRLFNPGNFMFQRIPATPTMEDYTADAKDTISVKGFVPLGPCSLTLVGLGEGGLGTAAGTYNDLAELIAVAGLFEMSLSRMTFGTSAYYRMAPGLRTGAYLKTPVAGVDAALEGVVEWGPDPAAMRSAALLASLFWEGGRQKWQLILEYLFDGDPEFYGHSVGLGIRANELLPGGWRPGLYWLHSFADGSGQFLLGLDGPIAKYLRLRIGFPFRYGSRPGSYTHYLVSTLPGVEYLEKLEELNGGQIPGNLDAAVLVMLTLSIDF